MEPEQRREFFKAFFKLPQHEKKEIIARLLEVVYQGIPSVEELEQFLFEYY